MSEPSEEEFQYPFPKADPDCPLCHGEGWIGNGFECAVELCDCVVSKFDSFPEVEV